MIVILRQLYQQSSLLLVSNKTAIRYSGNLRSCFTFSASFPLCDAAKNHLKLKHWADPGPKFHWTQRDLEIVSFNILILNIQ